MSRVCAKTSAGKQRRTARNTMVTPFPTPKYAGMANARTRAATERRVDHHQTGTIGAPQNGHASRYWGLLCVPLALRSTPQLGHGDHGLFSLPAGKPSLIGYGCNALHAFCTASAAPSNFFTANIPSRLTSGCLSSEFINGQCGARAPIHSGVSLCSRDRCRSERCNSA